MVITLWDRGTSRIRRQCHPTSIRTGGPLSSYRSRSLAPIARPTDQPVMRPPASKRRSSFWTVLDQREWCHNATTCFISPAHCVSRLFYTRRVIVKRKGTVRCQSQVHDFIVWLRCHVSSDCTRYCVLFTCASIVTCALEIAIKSTWVVNTLAMRYLSMFVNDFTCKATRAWLT